MPDARDLELDERLWERVHACLDARRDPSEDVELARALAAQPRIAARVAALRRGLSAMESRRRRRALPLSMAAAAALALAAALWSLRAGSADAPVPPTSLALSIERGCAPPPRGEPRRLQPQPVLQWIPKGQTP